MDKQWLAFDIGCIECGESSGIVGLFATKSEAEVAAKAAEERQAKDWHGQHYFEVFHLTDGEWSDFADKTATAAA